MMDDDLDWGDNLVAPFNHLLREALTASDEMDRYDLDSFNPENAIMYRALRQEYVTAALGLVDQIVGDPEGLREQLRNLLKDH